MILYNRQKAVRSKYDHHSSRFFCLSSWIEKNSISLLSFPMSFLVFPVIPWSITSLFSPFNEQAVLFHWNHQWNYHQGYQKVAGKSWGKEPRQLYLPTTCGREEASISSIMDPFSMHVLNSNKLCRDNVATWGLLHRSPPCSTFSSNFIHLREGRATRPR